MILPHSCRHHDLDVSPDLCPANVVPLSTVLQVHFRRGVRCDQHTSRVSPRASSSRGYWLDHAFVAHLLEVAIPKAEKIAKDFLVLRADAFAEPADFAGR